nr:MAG TPA: hypothetical protein [Caudoviricetes sp.]
MKSFALYQGKEQWYNKSLLADTIKTTRGYP